jgi:hypothetical protein
MSVGKQSVRKMLLDFPDFKKELYKASLNAIASIRQDCHEERLYGFVLMTTGLFGYIFPIANTEEGIVAGAEYDIVRSKAFPGRLDLALKDTRWEPSHLWRFFNGKHHDCFSNINQILESIQDKLYKLPHTDFDQTTAELEESIINVLNELRDDGIFGPDNENFYVNISYDDYAPQDLYQSALRLNNSEVCNRMQTDLSEVLEFWNSRPSESPE